MWLSVYRCECVECFGKCESDYLCMSLSVPESVCMCDSVCVGRCVCVGGYV